MIEKEFQPPDDNPWFGAHKPRSLLTAGTWAAIANLGNAVISLVSVVVLSRLLSPADIGLFTLALSFYVIPSQIVGPGLMAAAVQAPQLSEQQSSNLFWINVLVNGALATLLLVCTPFLAVAFQSPELQTICPVLAIVLVLEGFATQYRALLSRAMRFDLSARIQLCVAIATTILAIILAWAGFGVWAMVTQLLVGAIADRIALAAVVPWRPSWFHRGTDVYKLVHFGGGSSLGLGMHMLYSQSQAILMGRFATTSEIGFYNRGQSLFQKPMTQILGPLHAVLLPALSSRQHAADQLGAAVYRANALLYAVMPPLAVWMMLTSRDIATGLLGPAWTPAGDALFWFALTAIPGILFGTLYKSNEARGQPMWGLGIRAAFLPVLLAGLVWAAPRGAASMAAVGAVVEWLSAPVIFWLMLHDGPIPTKYFARPMAECLVATLTTFVVVFFIQTALARYDMPLLGRAAILLGITYAAGLAISTVFPFGRTACKECVTLWSRKQWSEAC